jgi:hypothetical protein
MLHTVQNIEKKLKGYSSPNFNMLSTRTNFVGLMIDEDVEKILIWLSSIDPEIRHQDNRAKRVKETGNWFLQLTEFRTWRDSESMQGSVFGCFGNPGAGKSIMSWVIEAKIWSSNYQNVAKDNSSLVIDHLLEHSKPDGISCVIWFYFDYTDQNQRSPGNIICSLLKQALVELHRNRSSGLGIPEDITERLAAAKERGCVPDLSEASLILRKALLLFSKAYICIDALDEFDENNIILLLRFLRQLLGDIDTPDPNSRQSIRLFTTGRPHTKRHFHEHLSCPEPPLCYTPSQCQRH